MRVCPKCTFARELRQLYDGFIRAALTSMLTVILQQHADRVKRPLVHQMWDALINLKVLTILNLKELVKHIKTN